jgi:hypothetical protein
VDCLINECLDTIKFVLERTSVEGLKIEIELLILKNLMDKSTWSALIKKIAF